MRNMLITPVEKCDFHTRKSKTWNEKSNRNCSSENKDNQVKDAICKDLQYVQYIV